MRKKSFAELSKIAKKAARKGGLNKIAKRIFHKKYDELTSSKKNKVRILYQKQKKGKKDT